MENRKKINKTQLQAKDDDDDKDTGRQEQQEQQPAAPGCAQLSRRTTTRMTAGAVGVNALTLWLPGLS